MSLKRGISISINNKDFKNYDDLIQFIQKSLSVTVEGPVISRKDTIKLLESLKKSLIKGQNCEIYDGFLKENVPILLASTMKHYFLSSDIELLRTTLSLLITITDNSVIMCEEFMNNTDLSAMLIDYTLNVCSPEFKAKLPRSVSVKDMVDQLILIVHNITRHDQFQQCFVQHENFKMFKDGLRVFLGSEDKRLRILTMAVLTWLAQDNGNDSFLLSLHKDIVDNFIEYINKGLKDKDHWHEGLSVWELLLVLQALSCMDSIERGIFISPKFMATIVSIFKSKTSLPQEIIIGLGILWNLCFTENNCEKLKNDYKIESVIKELLHHPDNGVADKALGFMWELSKVPNKEVAAKKATVYDVFVSYCHAQNDVVKQLVTELKKKFTVWIDTEGIKGKGLDDMAEGIEQSKILMMGVSNSYKQSQCCHSEASWAYRLKKPIIPLLMERKYKADGWLGMMISSETYIDVSNRDNLSESLRKIEEHIYQKCDSVGTVNITVMVSTGASNNGVKSIESTPQVTGKNVTLWGNDDVSDWLHANDLSDVEGAFAGFNGKMLQSLVTMKTKSYDLYHENMSKDLHLSLPQFLKFDSALSSLKM